MVDRGKLGDNLFFYRIKEGVYGPLKRGGYAVEIGEENMYDSKTAAIADIYPQLDKTICTQCDKRIFRECQSLIDNGGKNAD